jgi:hypothetical protein
MATLHAAVPTSPSITFVGKEYFHRWSQADQHEYTPSSQEDLEHWSDMVTVNYYRTVSDGDRLASTANAVLENYKSHKAMVLRTNSVPRRPDSPAEYLIVVLFPQPQFIEAVFTRFKIVKGTGLSVAYSHRIYGSKIGDEMHAWLLTNGPKTEKSLMALTEIPKLETQNEKEGQPADRTKD